jgi:hypothetical protein
MSHRRLSGDNDRCVIVATSTGSPLVRRFVVRARLSAGLQPDGTQRADEQTP